MDWGRSYTFFSLHITSQKTFAEEKNRSIYTIFCNFGKNNQNKSQYNLHVSRDLVCHDPDPSL